MKMYQHNNSVFRCRRIPDRVFNNLGFCFAFGHVHVDINFNLPFVESRATTCEKYVAFPNQRQLSAQPGAVEKAIPTKLWRQHE